MNAMSPLATMLALLAAGLAGSLHCVGMCGPILAGFQLARRDVSRFRSDFFAYHAGRIWTYALLGFAAGSFGTRLRLEADRLGWQRPLSVLFAGVVLAAALVLLGVFRAPRRLEALLRSCGAARVQARLAVIARAPGAGPRLLLGAVMGFLPCGLVYAMLAVVSVFPTPAHAALGMLIFGLGTIPALSVVLLLGRSLSPWARRHGPRFVAGALLLAAGMMLWRGLASPRDHAAHAGAVDGRAAGALDAARGSSDGSKP